FTTVRCALDRSEQATWSCEKPRLVTRHKLGASWPQIEKDHTVSLVLSKKGLIP
ncbi:hypothetical protein B296_00043301, partial [Ensete ventricosum]